ncbi:glycoside hydrolase superfamily [Amylostereum chailletii]|nr:glycoside hydrolase superfamily [Amylostereum chailletii]
MTGKLMLTQTAMVLLHSFVLFFWFGHALSYVTPRFEIADVAPVLLTSPKDGSGPPVSDPPGQANTASQTAWSDDAGAESCPVEPYSTPNTFVQAFPPFDQRASTVYRYRQQQAVNLGSWFVHEQWMTPSVFECAAGKHLSELDIASGWGSVDNARSVLERHWDTFIDESDFQHLASIGINTVRLPIGYWSLGPTFCAGTPFAAVADVYRNAWSQVVRAINMAGSFGIGVLVDLHGAPGSQNGQQHSGISDGQTNLFTNPADQVMTMTVLTFLVQQLSQVNNVVGVQMLNEPHNDPSLADFYTRAITTLRQSSPTASSFPLYLHDGFDLNRFSAFVAARTDFVVQDYHSYFVFTPSDETMAAHDHMANIKGSIANSLRTASAQARRNVIVGEWSCALTAESLAQESDQAESRREFCQTQMDIYTEVAAGWSFWSYDKEGCMEDPGWCFLASAGTNLPSTFFSYGQPRASGSPSDVGAQGLTTVPDSTVAETRPFARDVMDDAIEDPQFFATAGSGSGGGSTNSSVDWTGSPPLNATSVEPTTRGYSDGYLTAMIFAEQDMSKLGFVGQYVLDSIKALGPSAVLPGDENTYHEEFIEGLRDGEAEVDGISHL